MQRPRGARCEPCNQRNRGHGRYGGYNPVWRPRTCRVCKGAFYTCPVGRVSSAALLRVFANIAVPVYLTCKTRQTTMRSLNTLVLTAVAVLLSLTSLSAAAQTQRVRMQTNKGNVVIELDVNRAPLSVANFLEYVRAGHYDGTIFHRVIGNFVAQGGGYDEKQVEKPVRATVPNE